jgi:hypothetical protein
VKGGSKTIPLCLECHSKVHGLKAMAHAELTKMGLEAAKASGVLLGSHRPGAHRLTGGASLADIARKLTEDGLTTRTGKAWNKVQVGRVLKRVI